MLTAILLLAGLQTAGGTHPVSGIVVDPSGAPIAAALVRAASGAQAVETATAADGRFAVSLEAPLELSISAEGFASAALRVARDEASALRIVLQPRGIVETIHVSANPGRLRVTTPASATVLDGELLALAPAWTIDDQLRSVPGFSLFRRSSSRVANPTTQGVTLRGLAASGASRTAVFADGIPLNDPFGGWVYWDRVPAASVERIEVARGGSSDLHGSDALGGAIRIGTAAGAGARIWIDAGSHASARVSSYGGTSPGDWDLFGAGEWGTTGGFVIVAPESRGSIDIRATSDYATLAGGVGRSLPGGPRLEARGSYFSEDRGNGTPFQTNETIVRQGSGAASGDAFRGVWSVRAYAASQKYDQTFSAVAADRESERPTTIQHVETSSAGMTLEWLKSGARHGVLLSGAYRAIAADLFEAAATAGASQTLTPARQRTGAAALQASLQPVDRLSIGAGVRGDVWSSELRGAGGSRTLSRVLPRASVALRITDDVSVRTAVHRAYRTPTINELYRPFRVGNVLTRANPALAPEESSGLETAVFVRRGRAAVRAIAFWARLEDAVVNVTLESAPGAIVRERQNAGRIRAAGMELEGDVRIGSRLSLNASVARIDSVFTEGAGLDGLRVPQVPAWQAAAGVQAVWPRAALAAEWRFVGRQFDDDRNQFALDASSTTNARAGWRLRPGFEVFAALENAFDQEQDVGRTPLRTTGLPRTARAGVRWSR